ncbi:MAG: cytochrome-c peroxidase [Bacteroidia bacterium]|nr:cytochrome-c peroxidase [Bacteroidia bacterium]
MKLKVFSLWLATITLFGACTKDESSGSEGLSVSFYIPDGFPQPVYTFQNNKITPAGFSLGRKLFYDPILSRDSTTSCGSCHQQFVAFANAGHALSHGVDNQLGNRNSPGLFNMAWFPNFMWDGGVNHLEVQPLAPITNPVEMDESISNVIFKLQRSDAYKSMFSAAFGTDSITVQLTMRAMAQFMGAMISADSRYDQYRAGKINLSASEMNGLQLFRTHCENCHKEPLLTDMLFRNNGLDSVFNKDAGRAVITHLPQDSGLFRVPSLRNVALTDPYMHDGRFISLSQVLDHYTSGIRQSATLDPLLLSSGIPLTSQDKTDIISFLNTLTDHKYINDARFKEVQ